MKQESMRFRLILLLCALGLIVIIGIGYIIGLNRTVSSNIIQNISELAEHDRDNIQTYVEDTWEALRNLQGKFDSYHCQSVEALEAEMNVECANSSFSHIYAVGADGKVYTDKFVTYDPESDGQNGRIDLLPYFDGGGDQVVARFDDKLLAAGLSKESLLYGIRLEDFYVEEIQLVALVGITDIGKIQDRLAIDSFIQDGVSRGYSAVIDAQGNYVANLEQTVYLSQQENFFESLDSSPKTDLSRAQVQEKMTAGETFSFYHVSASGEKRLVYCMPFDEPGVDWYFISSVETVVFAEQNREFLAMSLAMLGGIMVVILGVLLLVANSHNKVLTANAEAKATSAFLANMSHEIRTPLNGIIGLIYLLEKDLKTDTPKELVAARLVKARETTEYLLSLINNILDVSKLQAGKVALNNEVISPELLADAVWSMQRSDIESRGIQFSMEKNIPQPWIVGDDLMIKQVLMNIVSNAAKFTPAGGSIRLSVSQTVEGPNQVATTFVCADTGCGMSPDFLEHIWDSFSQERGSNDESIKGTGLGMAISQLLVQAMGGEIRVESTLGEGSTFYVTLHSEIASEPPEYLQAAHSLSPQGRNPVRPLRILVAEDNELNAEILVEILESEGFSVDHAANGQEAVDAFAASQEGEIDVILMDMQMPVKDGCTAAREIRAMSRGDARTVSIFACTANSFNEDREEAEESGMDDFLSKPIDVHQLLKKLGNQPERSLP